MPASKELTLQSDITEVPLIGPAQEKKLARLGIFNVKDLLYHFPVKYRDTSETITIDELLEVKHGMVEVQILDIKNNYLRSGKVLTKATVKDETATTNVIWFNQRYLTNTIKPDKTFLMELKLPNKPGAKDFYCNNYEEVLDAVEQKHLGKITPIYDQTAGVSSKWLRARLDTLKPQLPKFISETLPKKVIKSEKLIDLQKAIHQIHFPENDDDIFSARERLGFEEMLELALKLEKQAQDRKGLKAPAIKHTKIQKSNFLASLNFELTKDQTESINEILTDISKPTPMSRLLNGDVGSGKTVVAAAGAFMAAQNDLSTVILAPTTILANQHYKSFEELFKHLDIKVQLLTSGMALEPTIKPQIIVGTHAILHEDYLPDNIGLVIVDEQHRFGVKQRQQLKYQKKGEQPHYLTMTATPIPRTLTNVIFGDMDISLIKEMPKHRIPITTHLVPRSKIDDCHSWVRDRIIESNKQEQAFFIYPLVEESEKMDLKAATVAHEELSKTTFKDLKVGLLHGRMKDEEKNQVLTDFNEKKYNVLIATTVVEVGIDITDATMMVIEGAERFGLAQLHQLRGRVGRGKKESFCYIIPSESVEKDSASFERLKYFSEHSSGFEVAEFDLSTRGPGEVYGTRQSGVPDFKIADITDLDLLKKTRKVAKEMISGR